MSMDVSSDLTALSSHRVPSVTGINIQVASPQGCTPGLAGPEPSGTFIHPGQRLQVTSMKKPKVHPSWESERQFLE